VLTALVLLTAFAPRLLASEADELKLLREQIRLLEQKLLVLERKQEIKDEAAAAAPKPPVVAAGAGGFSITSADKAYSIRFRALIQVDARKFFDDGAANRDQLLLRRIRLPITGTVGQIFEYNVTPEFATGTANTTAVGLWDAFATAAFHPSANLRVGKFPSPVILEPGGNRHFIEAPFANQLAPNRDLGFELYGAVPAVPQYLGYRLGLVTGQPNNNVNFGGSTPNLNDGDFTLAGRFTLTPFAAVDGNLGKLAFSLGFSGGNEVGTPGTNLLNGLNNITSNAQQQIFNYGANTRINGTHRRLSPAIEWYSDSPFSFAAEYIQEREDIDVAVGGPTRTFHNDAWRVSAGYFLTGENAIKVGVNAPRNPFKLGAAGWGAFEVVGRLSGLALDSDLFLPIDSGGAGISRTNNVEESFAYGLGLNWVLNRNVVFQFNIEQTEFEGGGTPTAQIGARVDHETAFLTRFHFQF
jgi:phosphate-selective porin OprO/OprP